MAIHQDAGNRDYSSACAFPEATGSHLLRAMPEQHNLYLLEGVYALEQRSGERKQDGPDEARLCSIKTETPDSPTEKDLTGKPRTSQWSGGAENVEIEEGQRKKTKSTGVKRQRGKRTSP